ncbi:MAG: hypothetical protein WCK28_19305 [Burkholderiales bacterium]|jgi:hypothetical protein
MEGEVWVTVANALLVTVLMMIPLWRVFRRTGRDPWLCLLFFAIPPVGILVMIGILAFGHWPAERNRAAAGDADPAGTPLAEGR